MRQYLPGLRNSVPCFLLVVFSVVVECLVLSSVSSRNKLQIEFSTMFFTLKHAHNECHLHQICYQGLISKCIPVI